MRRCLCFWSEAAGESVLSTCVPDIDFADSHALWALHQSGTFSQLDLRQSKRPLDAIPRTAVSWNTSGSIAFVTDRPKRWEVPYDDVCVLFLPLHQPPLSFLNRMTAIRRARMRGFR